MHASCGRYRVAGPATEEVVAAGRGLAARLGQLPGFVWFLLLEPRAGVLVSVSVFETATDLEHAEGVARAWLATQGTLLPHPQPGPLPLPDDACRGEVLVQRGL